MAYYIIIQSATGEDAKNNMCIEIIMTSIIYINSTMALLRVRNR